MVELRARARFRAIRKEFRELQTGWWLQVLPTAGGFDMSDAARELADITVNISDGLFVASQIDEDIDMSRRIELLTLGLQAIVRELITAPAAKTSVQSTRRKKSSAPKARRARALTL